LSVGSELHTRDRHSSVLSEGQSTWIGGRWGAAIISFTAGAGHGDAAGDTCGALAIKNLDISTGVKLDRRRAGQLKRTACRARRRH